MSTAQIASQTVQNISDANIKYKLTLEKAQCYNYNLTGRTILTGILAIILTGIIMYYFSMFFGMYTSIKFDLLIGFIIFIGSIIFVRKYIAKPMDCSVYNSNL